MASAATDEDVCGICFVESVEELRTEGQLAALDCCVHKFCCSCIFRWVETASVCPQCNAEVGRVERCGDDGVLETNCFTARLSTGNRKILPRIGNAALACLNVDVSRCQFNSITCNQVCIQP